MKQNPVPARRLITIILIAVAAWFGFISWRSGMRTAPDVETYSQWADILIADHFNYFAFSRDAAFVVPPYLYSGWVTVVAVSKLALGPNWPKGIVALNYTLMLLSICLQLKLVNRITGSRVCVIASGALALVAYELFSWIHFPLSDVSFMALTFAVFYLLCDLPENRAHRFTSARFGLLVLLVLVIMFYRPTGFPLLVIVPLALWLHHKVGLSTTQLRARFTKRASLAIGVLIIITLFIHSYFMMTPSAWPFRFASSWVGQLSLEYHSGMVVTARPETYTENPTSLFNFAAVTLRKLGYFFAVYLRGFSLAHKLANVVFFFPVYGLSLIAVYELFRSNSKLGREAWWAGWLALVWIISYAAFHALQQIDYDWRYRLTIMLPLIILASVGLRSLLAVFFHSFPAESKQCNVTS